MGERAWTHGGSEYSLFDKTELRISDVVLIDVNLSAVAASVAGVLGIGAEDVYVIDARRDRLALDIRRDTMDPREVVGKESAILASLADTAGVTVTTTSRISANGMLAWIAEDAEEGLSAIERSERMRDVIAQNIARRVLVLSTGPEVVEGTIEDTNQPFLVTAFEKAGYEARAGGATDDDLDELVCRLRDAAGELGFGLIVTTGGVGAESKDSTVEAILELDPEAATPHIAHFEQGKGRHTKDGVRIAVGEYGTARIVALPGPHDEVVAATPELLRSLGELDSATRQAERIARVLRAVLRAKFSSIDDPPKEDHD